MNHEPTNDAPRKGEYQRQIYDDAEVRKRTWKARFELVNGAKLRPALKNVLRTLWEYMGSNEFCWPSQTDLMERCGYGPNSRRALSNKLTELQRLGIVVIESKRRGNGTWRANAYRIDFDKLASLCDDPPPLPECEEREFWTAPERPSMRSLEAHPCARSDSYHVPERAHGMSSNGHMDTTSMNVQRTANERSAEKHGSDGGGGFEIRHPETTQSHPVPSGSWAGFINDAFDQPERGRLWEAAIAAGWLERNCLDKVRFVATALQARTRPVGKRTGWFIRRIEFGDWGYLDPKWVTSAIALLDPGNRPTKEQLEQVRVNRAAANPIPPATPKVSANAPG